MEKIGTRGQSENFFSAHPSSGDMLYDTMRLEQSWVPAAVVRTATPLAVETRHTIAPGDRLEYLGRSIEPETVTITGLWAEDGTPLDRAHPGRLVRLHTDPPLAEVAPATILRRNTESA
jgi:putative protease